MEETVPLSVQSEAAVEAAFASWKKLKESSDRTQFGLSFTGMDCYGYVSSALYQPTIVTHLYTIPRKIVGWFNRRTHRRVQILQSFEGLLKPGEMLLVLGRPGSGCSTFLKTLAGDTHGFRISDTETINYSGLSYDRFHKELKRERIYLAELDVHFPELTVGQTLEFANSAKLSPAVLTNKTSRKASGETVSSLFYLNNAYETKIGDAVIRGISGGEKRRLSLAEAFLGNAHFQFWDNSTRGLDSSTALRFIKLLRKSADALQQTIAMSIYQASEDMYQTFDKVILLYEGRQIYFGPVKSAPDYFTSLGFVKPPHATTPDFLTSLTNPAERIVQPGYESSAPCTPDDFAMRWKESGLAITLRSDIEAFNTSHPPSNDAQVLGQVKSASQGSSWSHMYTLPMYRQVLVCISRGFLRLRNNYVPTFSATFANAIIAIMVGTLYYQLGESTDDMEQRAILLFFATMHTSTTPSADIAMTWAQRPIVEKHDRYAFYRPMSEMLASIACVLPQKIVESILYNIPVYFMTNLRREADAFFTYWLFMFVTLMTMTMLFRLVGSLSRSHEETLTPVSILIMLCVIYTGFVVPESYMVPWLGWIRFINPMSYTYESIMINEFADRRFSCSSLIPKGNRYEQLDSASRQCVSSAALAGQDYVDGTIYLDLRFGYRRAHLWRNLGILFAMMIIFASMHLFTSELIKAQRSRGEILLFKYNSWISRFLGHRPDAENASQNPFVGSSNSILNYEMREGIRDQDTNQVDRSHHVGFDSPFHKQSSTVHWSNLTYEIKTKSGTRRILNGINGWVKPGTLTVMMGVTGAGKTTLLDVIACRTKVGVVSGDVYVNGVARDLSFSRRVGYVQQEDIHLPTATVREALEFSAQLRQPLTSKKEQLAYVGTVLKMLDMDPYSEAVVGVPGEGLNVEQRRRLTIAVELVAKPDILLFLDEPTSGLDSQTAWSICMVLRKLADAGQTILCTLHQPSSQLFQIFDRLLLLGEGGEQLYFGEIGDGGSTVIKYFEATGADKLPTGSNPAEWLMETTRKTTTESDKKGCNSPSPSEKWNASEEKIAILQHLTELQQDDTHLATLAATGSNTDTNKYAASLREQFSLVLRRNFTDYWRDPVSIYSKLLLCLGVSLTNGLSFVNSPLDIQGITNLIFSTLLVMILFVMLDQQVVSRILKQRDIFEGREHRNRSYSWTIFIAANVVVELFWQTIAATLFFITWYWPIGMWRNGSPDFEISERAGLVFVMIWLFCVFICTFSHAIAIAVPLEETAIQIASLLYWFMIVFCGVFVFPAHIPRFWVFVYRASPFTYIVNGLLAAGVGGTRITCSQYEYQALALPEAWGETCGEYLTAFIRDNGGYVGNPDQRTGPCMYCPVEETDDFFASIGMDTGRTWQNAGFLVIYIVFNISLTFFFYYMGRIRYPYNT